MGRLSDFQIFWLWSPFKWCCMRWGECIMVRRWTVHQSVNSVIYGTYRPCEGQTPCRRILLTGQNTSDHNLFYNQKQTVYLSKAYQYHHGCVTSPENRDSPGSLVPVADWSCDLIMPLGCIDCQTSTKEVKTLRFWRDLFSEFSASFLLIFVANACASLVTDEQVVPLMMQALNNGIAVFTYIEAMGHFSGAHMNPAVSLLFVLTKQLSLLKGNNLLHFTTRQTRDTKPMLGQCWANVADGSSISTQQWLHVSCLLVM